MKAAILGITGYTGQVLLRILAAHPDITEIITVSSSKAGQSITGFDPGISPAVLDKMTSTGGKALTIEEAAGKAPDVVFAALPHLESAVLCAPFFGKSVVIDLSADFRIKDPALFTKSYGAAPPRPDLLEQAVYGLCEWYGEAINKADLIANPGCYPTASLLPLLPLLKEGVLTGKIVINAISGISGAGKKLKDNLLFCERTENSGAYNPGKTHRHLSEIESQLHTVKSGVSAFFTPHLAPLKRGMAVTTFTELSKPLAKADCMALYRKYYGASPFIKLREDIPQTADTWGTNRCDISVHVEGEGIYLFSAIDNLMKGASGQAVQCMNIRFGLPETAGLCIHNQI